MARIDDDDAYSPFGRIRIRLCGRSDGWLRRRWRSSSSQSGRSQQVDKIYAIVVSRSDPQVADFTGHVEHELRVAVGIIKGNGLKQTISMVQAFACRIERAAI